MIVKDGIKCNQTCDNVDSRLFHCHLIDSTERNGSLRDSTSSNQSGNIHIHNTKTVVVLSVIYSGTRSSIYPKMYNIVLKFRLR